MSRARSQRAGSLAMFATLFVSALVVVFAARWAFRSEPSISQPGDPDARDTIAAVAVADPDYPGPFPSQILTVSLNDDLFPEATPETTAPPPPPPRLELDLIAITSVDDVKSIFAHDRTANEYFTAAVGDSIPSGPLVLAIEQDAVVFVVAGVEVRRELAP